MISSNLLTFRSGEKISAYHMYKQGNIGIAGHRDGFFRGLKDVHLGEYLDLYTKRETRVTSWMRSASFHRRTFQYLRHA